MENTIMCFECGSKNNYVMRKEIRKYEGDGYSFDLEIEIPFCEKCGAPIYCEDIEDNITKQANDKIRKSIGIITKDEIVSILDKYNLSQKNLSKLLDWGEITLTRYISGGFTPSKSNSNKLKELNDPYVLQKLLEKKIEETDGKIKEETYFVKAQNKINDEIEKLEEEDGKIFQVVNWFLSQTTDENPMTHLALQKLLYFTQCWSVILNGRFLFFDACEAWVHGAVYSKIYNEFKKFKYLPLPKIEKFVALLDNELDILKFVKMYYFDLYSAKTLEEICHREEPYILARGVCGETDICSEIIKKEDIERYYREVSTKYHISKNDMSGIKKYLYEILA